MAHVAFADGDQPYCIPMLYTRSGPVVYIHGSTGSRAVRTLARGVPACLTVTRLDGIVLARSVFEHSANYESVVVLGRFRPVEDPAERLAAFEAFTEKLLPGRWAEARQPSRKELSATVILALPIEEASVKARSGGPDDDDSPDAELDVWAGAIPFITSYGAPAGPRTARRHRSPRKRHPPDQLRGHRPVRSPDASEMGPGVVRSDRPVRGRGGGAERGLGRPQPGTLPHRHRARVQHVRVLHHPGQPAGGGDHAAAGDPARPVLTRVRHVPANRTGRDHRDRHRLPRGPVRPAHAGWIPPAGQPAGAHRGAGAGRGRLAAGRPARPGHGQGGLAVPDLPAGLAGVHADPGGGHPLVPVSVRGRDPARLRQDRAQLLLGLAAVPRHRGRGGRPGPAAATADPSGGRRGDELS